MKTPIIGLMLLAIMTQSCHTQTIRIAGYDVETETTTTGRMIYRSHSSYSRVHGQIGVFDQPGLWPEDNGGAVVYQFTTTQEMPAVEIRLNYSKHSPTYVPVEFVLDNQEIARLDLEETGSWNTFKDISISVDMVLSPGEHTMSFIVQEGQRYGIFEISHIIISPVDTHESNSGS